MNKGLIVLALLLTTTAAGMAGYRWYERRQQMNRVKMATCLSGVAKAILLYQNASPAATRPATTQPTTQSARGPMIKGCSKNHDLDGQNVLYADGHPEFQATTLAGPENDNLFGVAIQRPIDLWQSLKQGGCVIVLRHAKTNGSGSDPDNFKIDDRSTQRNLSDEGVAQAKAIGVRFRQEGVQVEQVLTSQYFRCRETAQHAFGKAEANEALNSLTDQGQLDRLVTLLKARPTKGNTVLVTHQANLRAIHNVIPEMGDAIVISPDGKGSYNVLGELKLAN